MNILSDELTEILKTLGYGELTDMQKAAVPRIKNGESLVISAPTGYGKTLAAFLPLLEKVDPDKPGIQLLYITPLRSLNRDIFKNVIALCNKVGVEVDVRHGDTSPTERANQARMPPHCLITTPETVQSIFLSKRMVEAIKNVKYVIVDEVQSLMESKRGTQFSMGLERLRRVSSFQIVGISATISNFKETADFLGCSDYMAFKGDKKYNVDIVYPNIGSEDERMASKENMSDVVANSLRYVEEQIKTAKSTLLFTNTRETAELLGSRLTKFIKDQNIDVHHSSLSKEVRTEIENKFKVGDVTLMIATSSLELGIDIGDVDLVIQYMSPRQVIKLVQRVGRSNHNRSGVAEGRILTINIDDYLESLAIKDCMVNNKLESIPLPKNSLDILAHQIVGAIIDGIGKKEEIFDLVKKSYAFQNLEHKKFEEIVDFLIKHYMIRYYGDSLIRTKRGLLFYIGNISTIPNRKTYLVLDSQLNKKIGVLDEGFVAEHGKEGSSFIMRGETWKIIKTENGKVSVVRAGNVTGALPAWEGELMPVHRFVAEAAADLRKEYISKFSILKEQGENFVLPDSKNILLERVEEYAIIHAPFGNKINEGLTKAISSKLSKAIGESVLSKMDPYRIMIKTYVGINELNKLIRNLGDVEELIKESIRRTSLYEYRFLNVAKRFGVVSKYADFTKMHLRSLIDMYKGSAIEEETYSEIFRDKIDLDGTLDIIRKIKTDKIKINVNDGAPSPLAYEGLDSSYGGSLMKPEEARKILRSLIVTRLKKTRLVLQCMNCGNKVGEMNAGDTEGLKCMKCGAKLIGFYKAKYSDEYDSIIKKGLKEKKLTKEERLVFNGIKRNAALYLGYGDRACLVGSSYGVGPTTASRILSKYSKTDDQLIDKIIEAERNYIETREFWK